MKYTTSVKLLLLILPLLTASIIQPSLGQERKSKIPHLIAQLNLSEGQKKKLEAMYEELEQKIKAIREDASLSTEDKKAKVKELNQSTNKFLSEVLTYKQREKLKELRQKQQPAQK